MFNRDELRAISCTGVHRRFDQTLTILLGRAWVGRGIGEQAVCAAEHQNRD